MFAWLSQSDHLPFCSIRMIFRGILVSLSVFYQPLLELLREVSSAKPMPFLTDFSLPTDIMQFLGLSDAFLQTKLEECLPQNKDMQQKGSKKKNLKKRRQTKRNQVDLGVAIQRGVERYPCYVCVLYCSEVASNYISHVC